MRVSNRRGDHSLFDGHVCGCPSIVTITLQMLLLDFDMQANALCFCSTDNWDSSSS